MENAVNQSEAKDAVGTVAKPETATVTTMGGSCPTCMSGIDPTIGGGDFQDALQGSL